jgi:CubicO group peptidase (beta-lactamase class C family)
MTMRLVCAIAAVAVLAASSAAAEPVKRVEVARGPVAEAIDRQLTAAAAERGFGGAVLVEVAGEVVLRAGYGYADRKAKTPFTADTTAQVGSVTKSFTALAVSQLVAEGRLRLDVPIRTYLPTAAEPAASATLHQLMTHTAGLDDTCGDDFDRRTRAEVLSVCMAMPLKHAPGEHVYSNMGLSMVAAAVEAASGRRWEDYLHDRVWRPFGMTGTGWTFASPPAGGFAVGYEKDVPQGVISDRIAALGGADWNLKGNGGIQASANDMHRYYRGLLAQPKAVRDLVLEPHADGAEADSKVGYGLFFRLDEQGRPYRAGHGGSDGVFFSFIAIYPGRDAFFYFVGNNGEEPVRTELRGILKTMQDATGTGPKPQAARGS